MALTPTTTRRREDLLDAVITQVMKHPRATLAELAEAAGVGRTTLFNAYATRRGLIRACGVRALTLVVERVEAIDTAADDGGLAALVEALIPLGSQLDFIWRTPALDDDEDLAPLGARYKQGLDRVVSAARQRGTIRSDVPDWWAVQMVESVVYVAWQKVDDGHLAPRSAPGLATDSLLQGVGR